LVVEPQAEVLRASLVIFVTSTTGQGDMPKNTLKFWKNLRREKLNNTNCLRSMRFTIFGLGDSSYLKCVSTPNCLVVACR
jgi:sulfite reductase alpha subunit-like flavoprotein